ncbi:hypothetical protein AAIA72_14960 [Hahella sp. SMD15-11]|uniref:Uncharacterized protein n=1 Tax=Thermohahella caldifontis TaxID=3142973 RepID=A0AB39UVT6_9GAMM
MNSIYMVDYDSCGLLYRLNPCDGMLHYCGSIDEKRNKGVPTVGFVSRFWCRYAAFFYYDGVLWFSDDRVACDCGDGRFKVELEGLLLRRFKIFYNKVLVSECRYIYPLFSSLLGDPFENPEPDFFSYVYECFVSSEAYSRMCTSYQKRLLSASGPRFFQTGGRPLKQLAFVNCNL